MALFNKIKETTSFNSNEKNTYKPDKTNGKKVFIIIGAVLVVIATVILTNHILYIASNMNMNVMSGNSNTKSTSLSKLYENKRLLDLDYDYLLWSVIAGVIVAGWLYVYISDSEKRLRKKGIKNKEYGSARWATTKEMQKFRAKDFYDDFLLSKHSGLSIPALKKNEGIEKFLSGEGVSDRNKHFLVIGGSGSGKTFNVVGPNLLQAQCSFVSTDPKGDTVKKYGKYLKQAGYKIKVINIKSTEQMAYSFRYNPFYYITDQASIMSLVSIIIENTSGSDNAQAKEDFWVKSERLLYMSLIAFLFYYYKDYQEYQTIPNLLDFIGLAEASEQDESHESVLDQILQDYKAQLILDYGSEEKAMMQPEWFIFTQYDGFKKAAGETAKSIIISCFVRLAPFAIDTVRQMFSADDLELEKLGEEKTALFLVMSDTDSTFNFVMAMILYQLFDINSRVADASEGSHLKIPIMCLLDEVANIGRIPDLEIKIATLRSRWINIVPILQDFSQLDSVYGKEKASIIKANCDTFLYLGRGDLHTCEEISKMLGKETIKVNSTSKQHGGRGGSSTSTQSIAHDLLSADEIYANPEKFRDDECLVMIKMARPYKDTKFMLFDHPQYETLQQVGEFSVESYVYEFRKQQEIIEVKEKKMREQEYVENEEKFSAEITNQVKDNCDVYAFVEQIDEAA